MKTVGIIGGVGPETTAEFYLELIFGCYAKNKTNRPPILINSIPVEYKLERETITSGEAPNEMVVYLINSAKELEKAGANFLVMPCNTLHVFIDEIRKSVKIPALSIVDTTIELLKRKNINSVAILATSTTINSGLYKNSLESNGIASIVPAGSDQLIINKIIHNLVVGKKSESDKDTFSKIIDKLSKQTKNMILACTDLQLLEPSNQKINIYDTMKIFADATINNILES